MMYKRIVVGFLFLIVGICRIEADEVKISIEENKAVIENGSVLIRCNLSNGLYDGMNRVKNIYLFREASFQIDPGDNPWREVPHSYKAESKGEVTDALGEGKKMRIWYMPQGIYKPHRFLDVTVYNNRNNITLAWGIHNPFDYTVRVREAHLLYNGKIFEEQLCQQPKVLKSGAGAMRNYVENDWKVNTYNGAMLTYTDCLNTNTRHTIVGGGLTYDEFARNFETHKGNKRWNADGSARYEGEQPFITLTVNDPQGKRVPPNTTWESHDTYYLDFITENPFESLEKYGKALALANNANPNKYDFPTLCGWMVSTKNYGEGKPINNSPGLVEQMQIVEKSGITKYTPVAVRLEPDYYCYGNQGNTQQGWWDDKHWAKYGSLRAPYETFGSFSKAINHKGGKVFTYFQASMPSNDFAKEHPDWMLNKDISLLHVDHSHQFPLVRYDYTQPEFQKYMLNMWKRLRKDGVEGIKFDYPETGWAWHGGFEDKSYTTTSAYRKIFQLCREGLGDDAYIHERILGGVLHESVPQLDCAVGVVDLQRVWGDASHFEPEMASRIGLRWYKQNVAIRYYPDGKSFYFKGEALSQVERRSFLTLIGLLSGRIELGTSFSSMTEEMFYDLTRMFPVLPNGKSFRPVDMFLDKKHPEVYVYPVNPSWKQVIITNTDIKNDKNIIIPLSGEQVETGAIGVQKEAEYYIFDFWNQKVLGKYRGGQKIKFEMAPKESRVLSIREVKNHPQVLGTNRHVMCGMMELHNTKWDESERSLSFEADLIDGEPMKVWIAPSDIQQYKMKKAHAEGANVKVTYEDSTVVLEIAKTNPEITRSNIKIQF